MATRLTVFNCRRKNPLALLDREGNERHSRSRIDGDTHRPHLSEKRLRQRHLLSSRLPLKQINLQWIVNIKSLNLLPNIHAKKRLVAGILRDLLLKGTTAPNTSPSGGNRRSAQGD